jgi:predicted enzyme related to lactoylglutathione lyase
MEMKGKIVHVEIAADDTQKAMKFWGEIAGWQFKNYAEGAEGAPEYNMFEGEPGGAIYPSEDGATGILVYFETDDIDSELNGIRDAGGTTEDKMPVPSMGWFAHAKDPAGNKFGVWQSDENAPVPETMGAESAS